MYLYPEKPKMMHTNFLKAFFIGISVVFLGQADLKAQHEKDSITYYKEKIKKIDSIPFEKAIEHFQRLELLLSGEERIRLLLKKAEYYADKKLLSFAKKTFDKALNIALKEKNLLMEAYTHHGLSSFYYNRMYQPSLSYTHSIAAQEIYKALDNQEKLNIVRANLAVLLVELKEFEKAAKFYKETLGYYTRKKDSTNIVFVSINLASFYQEKENYTVSDSIFKVLLRDFSMENIDKSLVYYNLAINEDEQKNYKKAMEYIDTSIALSTKINDVFQLTDLYYFKADISLENGEPKKALVNFKKSLEFAKEIQDLPIQEDILKMLMQVSIETKDYAFLSLVLKDFEKIKDSLANQEKTETLKEVHLKHVLDKKEVEIQLQQSNLKKEKKLKRLYFSVFVLSLLFLGSLIAYIVYYRRNSYKRMLLIQKEYEIKEVKNKEQRKYEELENQRIKNKLKTKKKELLVDLAFGTKRVEKIETVFKKMEVLSNKSIITKNDVLELKEFALSKYKEMIMSEKTRKDILFTNKEFYDSLLKDFPNLTKTELLVLSYISLAIDAKEIARIQNVSIDAIRKMRYRIRKKMNLEPEESLENFIIKYQ